MVKSIKIKEVSTNTLSCEPLVERTENGELLCVVQQGGVGEPMPENRVNVYHSKDGGETWFGGESIFPEVGKAVYATELQVCGKEITAYIHLHSGGFLDCEDFVMKSFDNGYTWENCGRFSYFPYHTFLRGTVRAKNGAWVMPYHHFGITQEQFNRVMQDENLPVKNIAHAGAESCETGVLISQDNGKTWEKHTACVVDMTEFGMTWCEPTIAEISNGKWLMLMRHERAGWLYKSVSNDGGKTWQGFEKTDIPNPTNKPRLIGLDKGRVALIHTPNGELIDGYGKRAPLEMWVSSDGCKTWEEKVLLTSFPGEYHYPDGFFENGHLHFVIEHNRHTVLYFDIELD